MQTVVSSDAIVIGSGPNGLAASLLEALKLVSAGLQAAKAPAPAQLRGGYREMWRGHSPSHQALDVIVLPRPALRRGYSVTLAPGWSPDEKKGRPCVWSQWRCPSTMEPSKGRPSSKEVARRIPVPASSRRPGSSPSWERAGHEVCPP